LRKNPTDVELESIAQTQSEHCKHKIFNGLLEYREDGRVEKVDSLFKTYIKRATDEIRKRWGKEDRCVSVFGDNAGVVRLNKDWNLTFKVETHNSPSALDPYGGAITGIVGVNRDPLATGKGSKLILNMYGYCFASPFIEAEALPYRAKNKEKQLLHPRRIFAGVRKGVEDGGNKSGIPTAWGFLRFDEGYLGKPLVYVGTLGIMPAKIGGELSHLKKANPGDLIVVVGGRIGKDGIHGATFSSESLHAGSPATAVQIGDPITQKKMHDLLLEARDQDLYTSITDNGAGGISCSVGEMARESGGCRVDLTEAPLKYEGLDPWEIWVSEAQERMTLSLPSDKLDKFIELAKKWGVEATVIGEFTDGGKCEVRYQHKTIMFVDLDFLHEGLPRKRMQAEWKPVTYEEGIFGEPEDLTLSLKEMLSRLNICSREYVVRQYDHEVQGMSVIKPLIGIDDDVHSDAAVIKPLMNSREGIILSTALRPNYGDIDTYHMAAVAIDEAIRNILTVGGSLKRIAILDNFCWSSSEESGRLAQLKRAAQACYDYAVAFGTPFISGKDSMFNDFHGFDAGNNHLKISAPPTLLISALGVVKDVRKCTTLDVKIPGDLVYVLGETRDELGASEYYALMGEKLRGEKYVGNSVPKVDVQKAKRLYEALEEAIKKEIIASCKNCTDGGLGVALAKTAFSGGRGIEVDLSRVPRKSIERNDIILFSESASRFVVTVPAENEEEFEKLLSENIWAQIGRVRDDKRFLIRGLEGRLVVEVDIDELKEAYKKPLSWG
ncbi:AIR synthase related protein, partial [candidate division NPL-UPA2 bacterium]|nr:AIR synthase related protein [candidate division NPL-UPA2 bacterium]